jgi:hypothetical protein
MSEVGRSLLLVGCVSVGFVISAGPGLVARAAEPDRWMNAIAQTASPTATSDAAQRRIAELEQRVKELEAAQATGTSPQLTAAMTRNEELATRNRALSRAHQELENRAFEASAVDKPPSGADARAHLRYWAKQLRDGDSTFRKMSPEWNAAVNVLLRRDRQLDPHNPWRDQ